MRRSGRLRREPVRRRLRQALARDSSRTTNLARSNLFLSLFLEIVRLSDGLWQVERGFAMEKIFWG